jgi:hypothetical protein
VPPQPSGIDPQFLPCAAQVVLSQQTCDAVQVCDVVQVPQLSVPPQPSETDPHVMFCAAHVVGTQPHTFVALHTLGAVQLPHVSVPPQPFEIVPQFLPCAAHVVGVQPHTFAAPPPPQVCGAVHSAFVQQLPGGKHIAPHDRPALATWLQPVSPRQASAVHASASVQLSNVAAPHVPLPVHDGARV